MNVKNKLRLAALAVMTSPVVAMAADGDPDLSAVTSAGAKVALVGAAVFTVAVGVKLFKWFKAAL